MGRIIAIDYGLRRVGLAVTDPLQIIATPLLTVSTDHIVTFLQSYLQQEGVESFVVGLPRHLDGSTASLQIFITRFMSVLKKLFPTQQIFSQDERYTSKLALAGMVAGNFKKKDRRNKAKLDKLSATIILQSFLASAKYTPV